MYGRSLPGVDAQSTAAWQCVKVVPKQRYDFGAMVLIPKGQAQKGSASIEVTWWRVGNCSDGLKLGTEDVVLGISQTPKVGITGEWVYSCACDIAVPDGAVAADVALVVTNLSMSEGMSFEAYFDDAVFREHTTDCSAVPSNHSLHRTRLVRPGSLRSVNMVGRAGELRIR